MANDTFTRINDVSVVMMDCLKVENTNMAIKNLKLCRNVSPLGLEICYPAQNPYYL